MNNVKIEKYFHHGSLVSVQSDLKGQHRDHCLCYQGCTRFKPGASDNCKVAQANLANCQQFGTVQPVWECPTFETKAPVLNNLVAFCGAAGAGKSTAADVLVAQGWRVVSFARPLKAMFLQMLLQAGVDDSTAARMIHGDLKETPAEVLAGRSPRYAMQTLGTEWGRDCMAADFWANLAAVNIRDILAAGGRVAVDDCRFANEAQAVRDLGGSIFEVCGRGGIPGDHVSEKMEFTADLLLDNSGAPEDLAASLETVLGSLAAA